MRYLKFLPLVLDLSSLSTAVGISAKDPSGVTFRDGSNLISSPLGVFGVKHPSILVYWRGTSSPDSLQIHSFCFKDGASSKAPKLGVIPEAPLCVEIKLGCCNR